MYKEAYVKNDLSCIYIFSKQSQEEEVHDILNWYWQHVNLTLVILGGSRKMIHLKKTLKTSITHIHFVTTFWHFFSPQVSKQRTISPLNSSYP